MSQHDTERMIEGILGDHPRAAEWRALRRSLEERRAGMRRQRQREAEEGEDAARLAVLDAQITALDRQVATLETEEAIAQFVEESLKFTLAQSGRATEDQETEEDWEAEEAG